MADPRSYSTLVVIGACGTWHADVCDALPPCEGEMGVNKPRYSAYYDADRDERLGVDKLIACGFPTNVCVESTVREALVRDIRTVVPSEETASVTPEFPEGALDGFRRGFGQFVTGDVLVENLARLPQAPA